MNKEVMSIKKQMFLSRVIGGISWIIAGIFNIFDNIPCIIITMIAMLVSICVIIFVMKAEKEEDDEMSLQHLLEAKAITQERMQRALLLSAVVLLFATKVSFVQGIEWEDFFIPVFYVLIGLNNLSVGLTFKELEEE